LALLPGGVPPGGAPPKLLDAAAKLNFFGKLTK